MFDKRIKLFFAVASFGYAVFQFTEGLIGNGVVIHLPGFFEELEKNIAKV